MGGGDSFHTHKPIAINPNQITQIISVGTSIKPISCQNKRTNHNPFTSICNQRTKTNIKYRTKIHVLFFLIPVSGYIKSSCNSKTTPNNLYNDTNINRNEHYITLVEARKKAMFHGMEKKIYGRRPLPGTSPAGSCQQGRPSPVGGYRRRR